MGGSPNQSGGSQSSRREFLKTSTAAVAGAGVLAQLGSVPGAFAGGDDTLRIGLVGCGGRGTGAAQNALRTDGPIKLVALADAFEDQLSRCLRNLKGSDVAERVQVDSDHQFVGLDAYQKLIALELDVVLFATPPGFRPIHFAAAVKAGRNVFMEKPVAVDAPGVRTVLAAAKEAKSKGLHVGVGLQRHHQKHYQEALERVRDGAIGEIMFTRVYWNGGGVWEPDDPKSYHKPRGQCGSEMEYQMRNWYYYTWLCGDHIVEQHIHNLDVSNWFVDGHPTDANGMGGREVRTAPQYGQIFDHHFVEFSYDNGVKMFSQCRHIPGCFNSVTEHIHGTKGVANLSDRRAEITGPNAWRSGDSPNPYQVEHQDLYASIRSGQPYNEAEYGAHSTMTAIFGRMATYSGKMLPWDRAIGSELSLAPKKYAFDAEPPVLPDDHGRYPVAVPGLTEVV
jgi:myo-inositol 2-dehydrogenase/D-chiro-inositol 1-dehydrogenase